MEVVDSGTLRRYILGIAALGAFGVVTLAALNPPWPIDPFLAAVLFLAMVVSVHTNIRYQRRGGVQGVHVNDGIMVALLFTVPLGAVPAISALAAIVGNALRTRDLRKVAFNAGAHGTAALGATLTFHAIWGGEGVLETQALLAVIASVGVYNLIDIVLYGELFHLLEGRWYRQLLSESVPVYAVSSVGNLLGGLLLAFIATTDRVATLFAFVLVVGMHLGYRGYAMAIEERNRNEHYHSVTRTLTEAVASEGSVERFLAAMEQLFGATRVELVTVTDDGPTLYQWEDGELTVSERMPGSEDALSETLRRGAPVQYQVTPDGGPRPDDRGPGAQVMAAPLTYHGLTIGALAVHGRRGLETQEGQELQVLASIANDAAIALQNVQLFRSVEHERSLLAEESQKLQDILDAASDGIAMVDADGRIVAWNPAMAQLTGTEREDALSHPWFMALRFRDRSGAELAVDGTGPLRTVLHGDPPTEPLDLQVLRRDGEWRWVRCTFSPVRRDDDGTVGVVLVARDVTRERETEEMKTDFIATVSHELRTPLTPLKGFLVTMLDARDRIDPDELPSFHRSMLRQVERLETLVADLLVVSDIDRGALRLRSQVNPIHEIVEGAVALERPLTDPDRIRIVASEQLHVVGDRAAIQRIVQALLNNAVKHTDGDVEIRITGDGERANVEVEDHGPGIRPADQNRIFHRFTRLGHHLTRATQGSGLGLSIARGLAERLGGELTVESEPGRGAVFTLSLPLAGPRSILERDRNSASA